MRTPQKTVDYEALVADLAAWAWRGRAPVAGPVVAHRLFVFSRPKKLQRRKDPLGLLGKSTRPDEDNLSKALVDGVQNGNVIIDDGQLVHGLCGKAYAERDGGSPRALLAVGPMVSMLDLPPLYRAAVDGPRLTAWWVHALDAGEAHV